MKAIDMTGAALWVTMLALAGASSVNAQTSRLQSVPASGPSSPGQNTKPAAAAPSARNAPAQATGVDDTVADIVVTAQKREQRLQDVPISITAVTSEEIQARNVTSLNDLQYSVPGLSIFSSQGPGQDVIQIGGVSNVTGLATVGTYLNEMAINGASAQGGPGGQSLDIRLLDLARIEVLRGPQGTLYGEGSMGGTIHYVTNSPDLDTYSGSLEGEVGHITGGDESYKINGVINAPLIEDKLGLRVVAGYQRDGGWIDNTATGRRNINDTEFKTVRAELLARPADRLDLSLLYIHQDLDLDYKPFGVGGKQSSAVQTYDHDRYDLVNGVIKYDLGSVQLLDSIGYLNRNSTLQLDLTPAFLPILGFFGIPPGFITEIPFSFVNDQEIFTNELRVSSTGPSRFNWTIGGYYRHAKAQFDNATSTSPGQLPFVLLQGTANNTSETFAFFGDAGYKLTDQLTVEIGARYFHDKVSASSNSVSFGAPTIISPRNATFESFDPRVNISYQFSRNSMVYASAAKGFRSGGFNSTIAPGVPETYTPDKLWHYEVGTKQQVFDRKLEFAADVYYTDWKNVQTLVLVPPSNLAVTENSGRVNGWGADVAVTARPVQGLTLTGTLGWNDLAYAKGTTSALVNPGDPVDNAVRTSYSASLDYRRPIFGDTAGFFRADYQHAGKAQLTQRNQLTILRIPPRDLVNLRAGLDFGRLEASVFATNVFNDRTVLFPVSPGAPFEVEQRPRTIGVNLRARF